MLFSDLEGSTALLNRLGSRYAEVLSGQREVLRQAWARHGGVEMGTEGDSFFVVFVTAPAAIQAAAEALRGLAARSWPMDVPVLVRIGIHSGSPAIHDGGYVGMDVHRAARISAAGHGGQIVVSAATAGLLTGALPADLWLSDLGAHQLKDIPEPERLFQLNGAGLIAEFPPLRSLTSGPARSTIRLGLPEIPGTLVGREDEVSRLLSLCADPNVRLVTVVGPGGVGKTRLAQEIVTRADGDAAFVSMLAAELADDVATTVLSGLGVDLYGDPADAVVSALTGYPAGLVLALDNFEHVLPAASLIERLLREVPNLTVLVTSRTPLNLVAELRFPLEPLSTTSDGAEPSEAALLLLDRMRRMDTRFIPDQQDVADAAAVAAMCDGLPLALEIAAARTSVFDLAELRQRLHQPLAVLVRPGNQGQRGSSVAATVQWSIEALDPAVARTLALSTVFRGGFTTAALSAVADIDEEVVADHLHQLLEHSLLRTLPTRGRRRFESLQVVREVAAQQLDVAERSAAEARFVRFWWEFLGPQPDTRGYPNTHAELDLISIERPNLRAAVRHSFSMDTSISADIVVSLGSPWLSFGEYSELRDWGVELLARTDLGLSRRVDLMLNWLVILQQIEPTDFEARIDETIQLATQLGDPAQLVWAYLAAAENASNKNRPAQAEQMVSLAVAAAESLPTEDIAMRMSILSMRGIIRLSGSDLDLVVADMREIYQLSVEHRLERKVPNAALNLSEALLTVGQTSEAIEIIRGGLAGLSPGDQLYRSHLLNNYGMALLETGDPLEAMVSLTTAVESFRVMGATRLGLEGMMRLAAARAASYPGDLPAARALGVFTAGLEQLNERAYPLEDLTLERYLSQQREAAVDTPMGLARKEGAERVTRWGVDTAFDLTAAELTS